MEIEMRFENCIEDSQYTRDDTDYINEYNKNDLDILKVDLANIYFDSEQNCVLRPGRAYHQRNKREFGRSCYSRNRERRFDSQ